MVSAASQLKNPASLQSQVKVVAPARLHLGFLDLGGHLGRRFGSIGVTINDFATEIRVEPAQLLRVTGGDGNHRVEDLVTRICDYLKVSSNLHLEVMNSIPSHAGLGSGTQMALAVGMAVSRFWGLDVSVRQIARMTGRGSRSGIGIAAFEQGGFIVDGGHGKETSTPPLLSRLAVPDHWRWLLIFDTAFQGLHGQRESEAFRRLPRFSRETAARLCHHLMIQGLPALAEGNYDQFCAALAEIQQANGDYFAPAQGGRYVSPQVSRVLSTLARRGWVGLGQSSWWPTGFCLLPDQETAARELVSLEKQGGSAGIRLVVVSSRNSGASING